MTDLEKRVELAIRIDPDKENDDVLDSLLSSAGSLVLNRMYPFGYAEDMRVPTRYEEIQIQLAVELYTQRGAEGQTGHGENGISRSWPEKNRLLSMIVPHCGSVMPNA